MAGRSTAGSILDCPICNEMFETPRILPCQHTVCENCLSSYIRNVTRDRTKAPREFPCPVCKRNTKRKEATDFQKNLTISALLDSKALKTKIKNSSLKKRAVTIETQTSIEDSAKVRDDVASSIGANNTGSIRANNTGNTGAVVSKPENRKKTTARDQGTGSFIEFEMPFYYCIFVDIIDEDSFEAFIGIYLMFVCDFLLCVCLYFVPLITSLLICYDLTNIVPLYTKMSFYISRKLKILKKTKWWHTGLLINLHLISNWMHGIFQTLLWAVVITLFLTFFNAITNKGSVFTIATIGHNYILFILNTGHNLKQLNDKVINTTCSLLEVWPHFDIKVLF